MPAPAPAPPLSRRGLLPAVPATRSRLTRVGAAAPTPAGSLGGRRPRWPR
ncbi:hypothetical protein [Streptomyces sp. enrichment culture]